MKTLQDNTNTSKNSWDVMAFFVFLYVLGEKFSQYKSLSIFRSVHKNYFKIMFDFLSDHLLSWKRRLTFSLNIHPIFFAVL